MSTPTDSEWMVLSLVGHAYVAPNDGSVDVRDGEPVVGLRLVDALHRRPQIRAVLQRRLADLFERRRRRRKVVRSVDVELFDRRHAIVHQRQQLDLRRSDVHQRGLQVRLELHALQLDTTEIDLRDVAGLEPIAADRDHLVVIGQVLLRQRQKGLGLQELNERRAQRERQRANEIALRRGRNRGRVHRAVAPQGAFVVALPEISDRHAGRQVLEVAEVAILRMPAIFH